MLFVISARKEDTLLRYAELEDIVVVTLEELHTMLI